MDFLSFTSALVIHLVLIWSGFNHTVRWKEFRQSLLDQEIWPLRLVIGSSFAVPIWELGLGVGGLLAACGSLLIGEMSATSGGLAVLAAFTYIGFFVIAGVLRHWAPAAPCGCSGDTLPATGWTTLRAGVLVILSLVATTTPTGPVERGPAELIAVVLAALSLAVLIWSLPAALVQNEGSRRYEGVVR